MPMDLATAVPVRAQSFTGRNYLHVRKFITEYQAIQVCDGFSRVVMKKGIR